MRNVETFLSLLTSLLVACDAGHLPPEGENIFYLHGKHHTQRLLFCGKLCKLNRSHSAEAGGGDGGEIFAKNLFDPSACPPAPSLRCCYRSSAVKDPRGRESGARNATSHLNVV